MKKLTILLLLIAGFALPMEAQPMTSLGTYGASGAITGWNAGEFQAGPVGSIGVEVGFVHNLYSWAEFAITDFTPFHIGNIAGVDYEFLHNPFSENSPWAWYVRSGVALGAHSYSQAKDLSFSTSATGVVGIAYRITSGEIFGHIRPLVGANFSKQVSQTKTSLQWGVLVAFGYRDFGDRD